MAIKIYWTNFAKKQLRNIFDYYKTNASPQIAQNIVVGIVEKVNSLEFQTEIGQKEELLLDRKENFRYLVFKKYKIIYWSVSEALVIITVLFWGIFIVGPILSK